MALETEKLAHRGLLIGCRQTWLPDYCQPLWEAMGGCPFSLDTECPPVVRLQITWQGGQAGVGRDGHLSWTQDSGGGVSVKELGKPERFGIGAPASRSRLGMLPRA